MSNLSVRFMGFLDVSVKTPGDTTIPLRWEQKYCVLRADSGASLALLDLFDTAEDFHTDREAAKSLICKDVHEISQRLPERPTFQLNTAQGGSPYTFACRSEAEITAWLRALNDAVKSLPNPREDENATYVDMSGHKSAMMYVNLLSVHHAAKASALQPLESDSAYVNEPKTRRSRDRSGQDGHHSSDFTDAGDTGEGQLYEKLVDYKTGQDGCQRSDFTGTHGTTEDPFYANLVDDKTGQDWRRRSDSAGAGDSSENKAPHTKWDVDILESEISRRCNLSGRYSLDVTETGLRLRSPGDNETVYYWPYQYIRRFAAGTSVFVFEAGRRTDSGPGELSLRSESGREILKVVTAASRSACRK